MPECFLIMSVEQYAGTRVFALEHQSSFNASFNITINEFQVFLPKTFAVGREYEEADCVFDFEEK